MRRLTVLSLLGVLAAAMVISAAGARLASAQVATTISVLKTCTGVPDPDAEFLMILQFNGANATNVVDATLQVGCGETATFTFLDGEPADQNDTFDVVEQVISGDVLNTDVSDCQDVLPVRGTDVGCTVFNELGDPDTDIVIVNKICIPPGATGSFEITLLDDMGNPATADQNPITIDCGETATFTGVPEGTYSAVEDPDDGQIVNDCQDLEVDVALDPPECIIENQVDENGTIIIEKDVDPEPDGTVFSFSDNIPGCNIPNLADDGAGGLPNSSTCSGIPTGDYDVTENPSTYTLVDIDCEDPDGGTTTSGSTASIDLDDGETIRCIFHNVPDDDGSITIIKDTNPETTGISFDFDSDFGDFDLDDDESIQFNGLNDTTFSFGENPPAGWEVVAITCNAVDYNPNVAAGTLVVDLQPGEDVTCTFVNEPVDDDGSITIIKETNPDTNDVFFDFDGDLGDFDLEDDDSITFTDLAPGTYEVRENEPSGWSLVDIVCNHPDVSFSGDAVFIDLDPGEHITCEFINQKLSVPTATPTKTPIVVIPVATATPTKTPLPPVEGPVRPPSAGDAGLLEGEGLSWVFGVLSIVAASGTAWVFIQHRMRHTTRK